MGSAGVQLHQPAPSQLSGIMQQRFLASGAAGNLAFWLHAAPLAGLSVLLR